MTHGMSNLGFCVSGGVEVEHAKTFLGSCVLQLQLRLQKGLLACLAQRLEKSWCGSQWVQGYCERCSHALSRIIAGPTFAKATALWNAWCIAALLALLPVAPSGGWPFCTASAQLRGQGTCAPQSAPCRRTSGQHSRG